MRGLSYQHPESVVGAVVVAFIMGCAASQQAAATADQVLDVITHRAEPLYQLTVDDCDRREVVAAELDPLARAEAEVARIRAGCDKAFAAWEALVVAQAASRKLNDRLRAGDVTLREAVDTALAVDRAYQAAKTAVEAIRGSP